MREVCDLRSWSEGVFASYNLLFDGLWSSFLLPLMKEDLLLLSITVKSAIFFEV